MSPEERLKLFETELNYIKDSKIKEFTEQVLLQIPDYFFHIGASSTGKYHPSYTLGEGGLVRHTQAAVRIAVELFRMSEKGYSDNEKDIVISSLILHDTAKLGFNGSKYTITEHPLEIVKFFNGKDNLKNIIDENSLQNISNCISSHMGIWDYDYKTKKKVLPRPKEKLERLVHMADYIASRKCLEFNFDIKVDRD
jgi:23S rRNA maturation-related 3'-5' exoribonuclease YhaM